jgi:hypothetical protein
MANPRNLDHSGTVIDFDCTNGFDILLENPGSNVLDSRLYPLHLSAFHGLTVHSAASYK